MAWGAKMLGFTCIGAPQLRCSNLVLLLLHASPIFFSFFFPFSLSFLFPFFFFFFFLFPFFAAPLRVPPGANRPLWVCLRVLYWAHSYFYCTWMIYVDHLKFWNLFCMQMIRIYFTVVRASIKYVRLWTGSYMVSCSGFGQIDFRLTWKSKFAIFGSSGRTKKTDKCEIFLDNIKILKTENAKFLGVIIDENLSWKNPITYIKGKISKNIGIISKLNNRVSEGVLLSLYDILELLYLNYCNIVWANNNATGLQP